MSSEISSKVRAIIVDKLGVDEAEVTESASFTNDLGADSLDTVEMLMDLESDLGVDLELEEKVATLGELADFIESKLD